MKIKVITIIGLILFCVVIILPPIIHGYVYPNIGDDTAVYLNRIEAMGNGGVSFQYLGYAIVGYPMLWLQDLLGWDIDTQFLWFNYISLAIVGVVLYVVFSRIGNRLIGWLALLLVLFASQGILFLFYYGQIFNIINIGIFFPLLLMFTVRYLNSGRWYNLVVLLVFVFLFSSFHANGIYLPAIAGLGLVVYVFYSWIRKKKIEKRGVFLGCGVALFAVIVFVTLVVLPTMRQLTEYSDTPLLNTMNNVGKGMAVPIQSWMLSILSPTILILFALSLVYVKEIAKMFNNKRMKIVGFILGIFVFLLVLVTFTKLSLDPWRQALDLATVFAFCVVICVGYLLSKQKNTVLIVIVVLALLFGLFHNLPTWFGYNSAIRQPDIQAIEYANNYESFSSSAEVAPWIYMRYTTAKHQDNDGDIVIMRSQPMTPRSTKDNIWYQGHGWQPTNEYELVKTIYDGVVEVQIWELTDWAREERGRME